jgi:hypothetical protein
MKAATLPPEMVAAIKATVRSLPQIPDERLDRIASVFARLDEDLRHARVRAALAAGAAGGDDA